MTAQAFLRDADADVLVIGGGIVGVSTAMQLTERYPSLKVVLLEKEDSLAAHQSGHNSGVIPARGVLRPGQSEGRFLSSWGRRYHRWSTPPAIAAQPITSKL